MGGTQAGMSAEQICAGIRQTSAAGPMAAPACEQATAAWRQALSQSGKPLPDACGQ